MAIPLSVVPDGRRALSADWIRLCGLLLLVLSLGSCDRNSYLRPFGYDRASLLKRYTPQDDESLAIDCVDLLQQGRYEEIEKRLDPSMKNSKTRESLAEMASFFPSKPISTKTVDASVVRSRDSSITSITLQYEFARGWLLAQLVIQTRDGLKTIGGFHVTPIAESVEVMNEFTFADKGISQYAGLVLAIFVSIFALYGECLAGTEAGWVVITVEETTLAQGNRFRAAAAAASALAYRRFLHQPVRHLLLLVQHSGRVQSFPRALGLA